MNVKAGQKKTAKDLVFALDIGTRSVIGLVGYGEEDRFIVQYVEREEYNTRAVVDGQIENIAETAKIVDVVKQRLEKKIGAPLKKVYIAAAGRVLRTMQATFTQELQEKEPIQSRTISDLELGAVQAAYEEIFASGEEQNTAFYCVGHAVQKYTLDGYDMSSLLDHKGRVAQAHIIATFLPRTVVESLYSTMGRCGLTVAGLTLEPIAAMNAIIPSDLRKLNLVLVDIGAGTSDIALCEDGSVTAYTMATIAGDEVTEAIMHALLVDFSTAETIKQQLQSEDDVLIPYVDILGQAHEIDVAEAYKTIEPTVAHLAKTIAERILEAGGHAPAAVFLAGGGSQVIGLPAQVAKELGLDSNRVAVGGGLNMKRSIVSEEDVYGPEFATPTGIALTAIRQQDSDTFSVMVNGEPLHLLRSWDTSVLGILQMAGYQYTQIMPRGGRALHCTVNGERRMVRGELPKQAEIFLNNEPAALAQTVRPGDELTFIPAEQGQDASVTIEALLGGIQSFEITLDGETYPVGDIVTVNGQVVSGETLLAYGDVIVLHKVDTVGAFCASLEIDLQNIRVFCNDEETFAEQKLCENDRLQFVSVKKAPTRPPLQQTPQGGSREVAQHVAAPFPSTAEQSAPTAPPAAPQSSQKATPPLAHIPVAEAQAAPATAANKSLRITLNHAPMELPPKANGAPYQFFDLLAFTDINPEKPQGLIVQKRNGKNASYLEILQDNDTIEIYWAKK